MEIKKWLSDYVVKWLGMSLRDLAHFVVVNPVFQLGKLRVTLMKIRVSKCRPDENQGLGMLKQSVKQVQDRVQHDTIKNDTPKYIGINSAEAILKVANEVNQSHEIASGPHPSQRLRRLALAMTLCVTSYFLLANTCLYASIATNFSDLVLENLELGGFYNLRTLRNCPMVIKNTDNYPIIVEIRLEIPKKINLMPGYEPIPDTEWLKIVPAKYRLGPFEKGSSDVIITIPNDEKLIGRHFQASILTSSLAADMAPSQFSVAVGCVTRMRFSVASMGPETLKLEKKRKKMMSLNFEMDPVNITVKQPVPVGRKINLRKETGTRLTLINRSTEPVPLNMLAENTGKDSDYEPGDPKFLIIKPKKLKLKGESMEKLDIYLQIPNEENYKNKKFVFLIKAQVQADVPVEVYSKLYLTTAP